MSEERTFVRSATQAEQFAARYRAVVESLARAPDADDGVSAAEIELTEERLGVRMPEALAQFYRTVGLFEQLTQTRNRLLPLKEAFLVGDKLVFMEEKQLVTLWGVKVGTEQSSDPPVFQGENSLDKPIVWNAEHDKCCEFLVVMLHCQAVRGGMEFTGIADITADQLARLREVWPEVGRCGDDLYAFGRDGRAACVICDDAEMDLLVGGRTQEDFDKISWELAALGIEVGGL